MPQKKGADGGRAGGRATKGRTAGEEIGAVRLRARENIAREEVAGEQCVVARDLGAALLIRHGSRLTGRIAMFTAKVAIRRRRGHA